MNNLCEESAHRIIHKKAMDTSRTMKEIAESIILMGWGNKKFLDNERGVLYILSVSREGQWSPLKT